MQMQPSRKKGRLKGVSDVPALLSRIISREQDLESILAASRAGDEERVSEAREEASRIIAQGQREADEEAGRLVAEAERRACEEAARIREAAARRAERLLVEGRRHMGEAMKDFLAIILPGSSDGDG